MSELFKNLPIIEETKEDTASKETESTDNQEDEVPEEGMTELDMLKARAKMMGIPFSNNIGIDTLREKVNDTLNGVSKETDNTETDKEDAPITEVINTPIKPVKKQSLNQYLKEENMRLIRVRITNMDPKKKDLHGEIITVANDYLGTVKKFVPFGEKTENGYHIPYVIYKVLKRRKFLQITTKVDQRTGQKIVSKRMVREFAIEVLPQLTQDELNSLAVAQMAAGSTEVHN